MKRKQNKKPIIMSVLVLVCCVIFIVVFQMFSSPQVMEKYEDITNVQTAEGFTIEAFYVTLDVKEDNKVDVTEKIMINWYETGHHGIYAFVPEWLEYTGQDGKTIKRKSKVSDLKAEGDPYTTSRENKKAKIQIGSADKTLQKGNKMYTISYTYDMGNDPYEGFDEFIFHTYGDYWGTEIKNAYLEVHMPKDIERDQIHFYKDKYRQVNADKSMEYSVSGNVLQAAYVGESELWKSLTLDIELPDHYFAKGSWNYGYMSLIISCIVLVLTVLTIRNWFKYGKDLPKVSQTVEFYPPEGLTAAEIGYIYAGHADARQVIALIIQLAAKGYIKIDDLKQDRKEIQITNLCTDKDHSDRPALSEYEDEVYQALFKKEDVVLLNEHKTLYKTFPSIENKLEENLHDKIEDKKAERKKIITKVITIAVAILAVLSYVFVEDLDPKISFLYEISFVCIFVNWFFVFIMKRKTSYGEQIIARINGFRDFLVKAEKPKLEELVSDEPQYFYDILPYTYVLNVSKVWIRKFEDIAIPQQMDMGTFDYSSDTAYFAIYDTMYQPAPSSDSSSGSSGCSSCGGGCSSCGGGGSW